MKKELIARELMKETIDTVFVSHDKQFEKLDGKRKTTEIELDVKYYRQGNKIIVKLEYDGYKARGTSKCHPDDEFNIYNGMMLALTRARKNLYNILEKKIIKML